MLFHIVYVYIRSNICRYQFFRSAPCNITLILWYCKKYYYDKIILHTCISWIADTIAILLSTSSAASCFLYESDFVRTIDHVRIITRCILVICYMLSSIGKSWYIITMQSHSKSNIFNIKINSSKVGGWLLII